MLILLIILGCSQELAPDRLSDSVESFLGVLRTITYAFLRIVCEIEYRFNVFMDFWALNFFRGFQLWVEIYFSFWDYLVDFLCSDFMITCYFNTARILYNVSLYINDNVNIWFLQHVFRVRFQHTSHSVVAQIGFSRVVYVPDQRSSTLLLCFLIARATIPLHMGVLSSAGMCIL